MDSNNIHPSSCTYTLQQLLGESLTLVIPDMQRDYCWGTEGYSINQPHEKVTSFISGLVFLFKQSLSTHVGLLYGYQEPYGSGHIHIIDGQQRITTLYLLIGMLYRRNPSAELRRLLISDYELIDDKEPRLLYQVRTRALYFMSDLVINFFLNRDGRLSQLEKSIWYNSSYDSDPTVQSFIGAIRCIDKVLEEASTNIEWDFASFTNYITKELTFLYHDLGNRGNAQQMFITINTTGEPLTPIQIQKLKLVSQSDKCDRVIDKWEEIEKWAWSKRQFIGSDDNGEPLTQGVINLWNEYNRLLMTNLTIENDFGSFFQFWLYYKKLTDEMPFILTLDTESVQIHFRILPTLAYIIKWGNKDEINIMDTWAFFSNISRYLKATASGSDTAAAIKIIEKMPTPDIVSIVYNTKGISDRVLNQEEKIKLKLLSLYPDKRTELKKTIEWGQEHPMLNGKIGKIILWCTDRKTGEVDIYKLKEYISYIYKIWGTDINDRMSLDIVRCALLTLRHPEFPIIRRGETAISLCWHDYDWIRLMTNAPGLIRLLIDRISESDSDIEYSLKQLSARFNDRNHPYFFLIKNSELLREINNRSLMRPCEVFLGYYSAASKDANVQHSVTHWYVEQRPIKIDLTQWTAIRQYGTRCLYTDNRIYNVSIDLYYTPDSRMSYRIEVFSRPETGTSKLYFPLKDWVRALFPNMRYEKARNRFYMELPNAKAAINLLSRILEEFVSEE